MKYFKLFPISLCLVFCFLTLKVLSQKRIAVIGSSSAAGYFPVSSGYPKDSAWVYKIKKHFKDLGIIDTLFNLAQSSTDCFEGMPTSYIPPTGFNYRLPNPNINITRAVNLIPKPDVIIVNYPSNSYDWIANDQVITCLQIIKDSANAKNIPCFITTTQPRDGFSATERQKLKTLRDMILARFGEYAIDFFTDIVEEPGLTIKTQYAIGDGVHLNPEGHTVLKNKVLEKNIFLVIVPVRFGDLFAITQDKKIILKWKTLFETNINQFIIETSTDGIYFKELATIPSRFYSSTTQQYSFMHNTPENGENWYRIVAISASGLKLYSNIAIVKFNKSSSEKVNIMAVDNRIILSFKKIPKTAVIITFIDSQGKLFYKKQLEVINTKSYTLPVSDFPAGKYFIQCFFDNNKETGQFVKYY